MSWKVLAFIQSLVASMTWTPSVDHPFSRDSTYRLAIRWLTAFTLGCVLYSSIYVHIPQMCVSGEDVFV
jgi:hypothetical protein